MMVDYLIASDISSVKMACCIVMAALVLLYKMSLIFFQLMMILNRTSEFSHQRNTFLHTQSSQHVMKIYAHKHYISVRISGNSQCSFRSYDQLCATCYIQGCTCAVCMNVENIMSLLLSHSNLCILLAGRDQYGHNARDDPQRRHVIILYVSYCKNPIRINFLALVSKYDQIIV